MTAARHDQGNKVAHSAFFAARQSAIKAVKCHMQAQGLKPAHIERHIIVSVASDYLRDHPELIEQAADPASDGGVVGTPNYRGISLGKGADIYCPRQRPSFR